MKLYKFATIFVTLYLVVYTVLLKLDVSINISLLMFSISPFLVIWMAYTILKNAPYHGRELKENEEWGYQDEVPNR